MLPTEDTVAERVIDPEVQREMQDGEVLLWWGRPDPKRSGAHTGTVALERAVWLPVGAALILLLLAVLFFFALLGPLKQTHLLSLLLVIGAGMIASSLPKKLPRYRTARH